MPLLIIIAHNPPVYDGVFFAYDGIRKGESMKILVFSDSHGDVAHMVDITAREKPDAVMHLGDHIKDAMELEELYPAIRFYCVKGNTDFYGPDTAERFFELMGVTFLLAHGHQYGVKTGLKRYREHAHALGADIALYGHTHIPHMEDYQGGIIMNPGRIGRFLHNDNPPSYGVIHLEDKAPRCDIIVCP